MDSTLRPNINKLDINLMDSCFDFNIDNLLQKNIY